MVVDCDGCVMREIACGDCVVTVLLGPMNGSITAHKDAFDVLASAGLTPPLRLVQGQGLADISPDEAVGL
jgi:hypothetical protein